MGSGCWRSPGQLILRRADEITQSDTQRSCDPRGHGDRHPPAPALDQPDARPVEVGFVGKDLERPPSLLAKLRDASAYGEAELGAVVRHLGGR